MPLLQNLDLLMARREHPRRLLAHIDEQLSASLNRYYEAVPSIIEGHRAYRLVQLEEAAWHYLTALRINPEDAAVRNLLDFEELRRTVRGQPDNLWARWQLGKILAIQQRDSDAAAQLNTVVEKSRESRFRTESSALSIRYMALLELAGIYERSGNPQRAQEYRREAEQLAEAGVKAL